MKSKKLLFLVFFSLLSNAGAQNYNVGDHELLFMPTAATMPKDSSYIASYELILLNYTYAVTGRTHISALMMFPITVDAFETFSIGIKQNYYRSEIFQGAVFGSFTFKGKTYSIGNVFSFGKEKFNAHIGLGYFNTEENNLGNTVYMIGVKGKISRKISLIAELEGSDKGSSNLISFGVRFTGETLFFDLGGFRPTSGYSGDLIMFPFVKGSFLF
jgi:hypothetical protein